MKPSLSKEQWDFNGHGEILFVDKPLDWTSQDIVKKVRSLFHVSKCGHAGTLDPRATGLLIVSTGRKTKEIDAFVGMDKEYVGTLELGIRTPSFDLETAVTERKDFSGIHADEISAAMMSFVGRQTQLPPMYSASKSGGKPLYRYARKGRTIERLPKEIRIDEFLATRIELPAVDFRVVCSKGTYIRALVDDLGQKLGPGACLVSLRRTRIGKYGIRDASTVEDLIELAESLKRQWHRKHESSVLA